MTGLLLVRLAAGSDLVEGVEDAARTHGILHGIVHGGPGSLMRACVEAGGPPVDVPGPAAEILTMTGELREGIAVLHGTVGDPDGTVYAGRFIRGRNPVCITVELAIELLKRLQPKRVSEKGIVNFLLPVWSHSKRGGRGSPFSWIRNGVEHEQRA